MFLSYIFLPPLIIDRRLLLFCLPDLCLAIIHSSSIFFSSISTQMAHIISMALSPFYPGSPTKNPFLFCPHIVHFPPLHFFIPAKLPFLSFPFFILPVSFTPYLSSSSNSISLTQIPFSCSRVLSSYPTTFPLWSLNPAHTTLFPVWITLLPSSSFLLSSPSHLLSLILSSHVYVFFSSFPFLSQFMTPSSSRMTYL